MDRLIKKIANHKKMEPRIQEEKRLMKIVKKTRELIS